MIDAKLDTYREIVSDQRISQVGRGPVGYLRAVGCLLLEESGASNVSSARLRIDRDEAARLYVLSVSFDSAGWAGR